MAIKDKEKLKNDKHSQRYQMIDSDLMPMAFEIYGACSEKFEDFLEEDGESSFRCESCSLFCVAELLEETLFSYSSSF